MPAFFTDRRSADPAQRPAYARYLAQRMGPMIYAMLLMAALSYLIATCARALIATSPVPLHWRLLPVLPLAIVVALAFVAMGLP
ncbi:MAG: GGDEF domain-containing protein, partial [Rhodanobacter sp.]